MLEGAEFLSVTVFAGLAMGEISASTASGGGSETLLDLKEEAKKKTSLGIMWTTGNQG